ncbi:MAG: ATP-binding protein [Thermodesulfobacteriota bacterium]
MQKTQRVDDEDEFMTQETAGNSRRRFLKRRTIASDLTIGIALTILAVTSVLSLLEYRRSVHREEERLERLSEDMAEKLVAALTLPLWNINHHAVRMVADAYAQTQDVVGLRIVDDAGSVIYEVVPPQEPDLIEASRTVRYREQEIGRIEVALTARHVLAVQKRALVFTIAVIACVTLAIIVVIQILLKVFLRRPLAILAQGLETIASGSYDHKLPPVKQQDVDAIIRDVNAMAAQIHQRDRDLRESWRRYQELANLLPETIYETDTEGRFLFLSRSGFNAFGLSADDFERGLHVEDLFSEQDLHRIHDDMQRIISGGPVGATEYTAVRKDGTRFPVLVHSSAMVREKKPCGIRAIAVDITNRKRMEQELARLASGIAHQVRNPLTTIGGFAVRLQKLYAGDESTQNWLEIMLLEVRRLERMVADIHELTSLRKAEPKRISFSGVVNTFIADCRLGLEAAGIRIHQNLPEGLPEVTADKDLLFAAFEKIVENTVEAMPEGGEMKVSTYSEEGQVCVVFSDSGPGISENHLPHVFEPFYGSKPQASGLGLTMAQRIVHEQRGRIAVESSPGRGTDVKVCLPAVPLQQG